MSKNQLTLLISERMAAREKPALPLSAIVARVASLPAVLEAVEKYMNGKSPAGNTIADRCFVAEIIREEAKKMGMVIPASITSLKIARHFGRELEKVGIPLTKSKRIDMLALEMQGQADAAADE
jgi:hypothetical protein